MTGGAIAVIGLGIMGSRMANRLRMNGHALRGYDPNPASLDAFAAAGGVAAGSPAEAVQGCWAALLSLPDSDISRRVCLGEGGVSSSGMEGLLVLDTTTGRPEDAVTNAGGLAGVNIDYGDTTVSGNAPFAGSGQLVVMFGGTSEDFEKGRPVFEAIGRSHHHVGPVGAGARVKLIVNQILSIQQMALAEVVVTAELAGLDLERVLEVLKDSLAYAKVMDVYGDNIVAGTHDPPAARLRQTHKDARLMIEHAASHGAPADLIEVVQAALAEGEASGLGDLDNSAIAEVVRRRRRHRPRKRFLALGGFDMARIRLITDRDEDLSPEQIETFDWVVESRGRMIRPFEVLLHSPQVARHVAELGAKIRFDSSLLDHDRELVILTAALAHGCAFEWDSHLPLARAAGVREEVLDHLREGGASLTESEALFIDFVRELCAGSTVSSETFERAKSLLGESGVVELSATVGYYTMMAMVMGACDAC